MPYQIVNVNDISQETPNGAIGIKLPFNGTTGIISSTVTSLEQAISNLKNLLLTYKGERINQPNFGTDLPQVLFQPNLSNLKTIITEIITDAASYWLPYINITSIDIVTADDDPDLTYEIKISISFNVPAASIVEDAPTVTIFVENNQLTVS
jgi:phage baseplate assembly protein W